MHHPIQQKIIFQKAQPTAQKLPIAQPITQPITQPIAQPTNNNNSNIPKKLYKKIRPLEIEKSNGTSKSYPIQQNNISIIQKTYQYLKIINLQIIKANLNQL
ncbi:hypothetical protein ACTFIV_010701 [Dictyostelium citrinum]